jgi:hypothetical protein
MKDKKCRGRMLIHRNSGCGAETVGFGVQDRMRFVANERKAVNPTN